MAKVYYDQTTPFGSKVFLAIQAMKNAQGAIARCRDTMDAITNFAANPAALEGSKEFGVAAGGGPNFYNAVTALQGAIFTGGDRGKPIQPTIDLDQG